MEVDIPNLLETIAVCDPGDRIADEAKTVLRMSRLKCPSLGKEESLRSFIAVDLALGKLGVACSQDKLVNAAHAKDQTYKSAYSRIRNLLGQSVASDRETLDHLAVKFPGASAPAARVLLHRYEEACRSSLTTEKRFRLDIAANPVYQAAAFLVASAHGKMKVDRKAVAGHVKADPKDLDRVCVEIARTCGMNSSVEVRKEFRMSLSHLSESSASGNDNSIGGGSQSGKKRRKVTTPDRVNTSEFSGQEDGGGLSDEQREGERESSSSPTSRCRQQQDNQEGAPPLLNKISGASSTCVDNFLQRLATVESPWYRSWRERVLAEEPSLL